MTGNSVATLWMMTATYASVIWERGSPTAVLTGITVEQRSPRRCRRDKDIARRSRVSAQLCNSQSDTPDHDDPSQSNDERDTSCNLGTLHVTFCNPLFNPGRSQLSPLYAVKQWSSLPVGRGITHRLRSLVQRRGGRV